MRFNIFRCLTGCLIATFSLSLTWSAAAAPFSTLQDTVSVGVYYFPGWHKGARGLEHPVPWAPIKKYPERKPKLGWYDDADPEVLRKQLKWMSEYGVDYVVFDWYWDVYGTFLDQVVNSYSQIKASPKPPFAIMWANHGEEPSSRESFRRMVQYWIGHYLSTDGYLRIQGLPVVFLFKGENLDERAKSMGTNLGEMLVEAQEMARQAGLPGIFFVSGASAGVDLTSQKTGVGAYSAYNYHGGPNGITAGERRGSRSFLELTVAYKEHWQWFADYATLPYIVPVTAGWDRRAWGGSEDPRHDLSYSTPAQFGAHLKEAGRFVRKNRKRTASSILVCCWNEYGEGSVVEPTEKYKFQYLEQIKRISPGFQPLAIPIAQLPPDEKRKDSRHIE